MMNIVKKIASVLILILANSSIASEEKVTLVADYWCPYNCEPNSDREGLLVEIARIAFAKKGIKVDYQLKSWREAVDDFNNGKVDGIIGAGDGDVDSPVLPSIEQANSTVSAFTLKDTTWIYDGPNSLNNKVLGIIEGYTYANDIKSFIYSNYISKPENFVFSSEENAMEDNVNKLLSKEIFVYIEDNYVIGAYMAEKNITNIRNAGSVQPSSDKIYIAFPSNNPKSEEYARLVTDTTFELKTSGKLAQIQKKYGVKSK